jgi:hypothetical protein
MTNDPQRIRIKGETKMNKRLVVGFKIPYAVIEQDLTGADTIPASGDTLKVTSSSKAVGIIPDRVPVVGKALGTGFLVGVGPATPNVTITYTVTRAGSEDLVFTNQVDVITRVSVTLGEAVLV